MRFLPIFQFRVLTKRCGHLLDQRLAPLGMNTTKAKILMVLTRHEGMTATELLPIAGIEPASMTLLLQSLERAGWIQRTPHPTDKRAVIVSITEGGRAAHESAFNVLEQTNDDLFGALSEEETAELERVLTKLSTRLETLGVGYGPPVRRE